MPALLQTARISGYLPLFISVDTIRSLVIYRAQRNDFILNPVFVVFAAESCKLIVALVFHLCWLRQRQHETHRPPFPRSLLVRSEVPGVGYDYSFLAKLTLPAALYLVNNVLFLLALRYTSPAYLSATLLTKLPLTAIMHALAFDRRRHPNAWIALAVLTMGIICLHVPPTVFARFFWLGTTAEPTKTPAGFDITDYIGAGIGLLIAVISSCSSVATEFLLKQKSVPFWTIQVWLYLYGSLLAASYLFCVNINQPMVQTIAASAQLVWSQIVVVLATAASGLVVALILREGDILIKLIGSSATVVTSLFLQPVFWSDLAVQSYSPSNILSAGIVTLSAWCYNFWKDQPRVSDEQSASSSYVALGLEESEKESAEPEAATPAKPAPDFAPTPRRLCIGSAVFVALAVAGSLLAPTS